MKLVHSRDSVHHLSAGHSQYYLPWPENGCFVSMSDCLPLVNTYTHIMDWLVAHHASDVRIMHKAACDHQTMTNLTAKAIYSIDCGT